MKINLAHFAVATDVLGPGKRAIIWVQGCPKRCKNCITPQMQPFIEKELVEPAALANRILALKGNCPSDERELEGITLVGGEPFSQAQGLSEMIEILKAQSDLSVVTFTGHTLQQIQERNDFWWSKLLSLSDILIDGEYIEELASDLLWRGSSNQKIYFLTDRYQHLEPLKHHRGRYLEFDVTQEGELIMIGIPSPKFHRTLTEKLAQRGIQLESTDKSAI